MKSRCLFPLDIRVKIKKKIAIEYLVFSELNFYGNIMEVIISYSCLKKKKRKISTQKKERIDMKVEAAG